MKVYCMKFIPTKGRSHLSSVQCGHNVQPPRCKQRNLANPLSDDSRLLTTFITPFDHFCYNKLPFGISSVPDHFQMRMSNILSGLQGVFCHMDDVLVFGWDKTEHDNRLTAVLTTLQSAGVTLNKDN